MPELHAPINIFSGVAGLGGYLTNPTEMARAKGCVPRACRVTFAGKLYPDAEAAYQANKRPKPDENDTMMAEVIAAKFRQHPFLVEEVQEKGGAPWLATCSHFTGAKTPGAQSWEGAGLESRFIRNLVRGYELFLAGRTEENGQSALF